MFLHIGLNTAVDVKDIIAVINIENGGSINLKVEPINVSGRKPKSLVVTNDGKRSMAYLSHISSMTLKKRIG